MSMRHVRERTVVENPEAAGKVVPGTVNFLKKQLPFNSQS